MRVAFGPRACRGAGARSRRWRASCRSAGKLSTGPRSRGGHRSGGRSPTRSRRRSSRPRRRTRPTATGWSAALTRRKLGIAVNRKRVLRVMREQKLIQRRRREPRRRRPGFFRVERPDQLWHLDMTSVWVAEHGWCYLNAAIDCCTREIVGLLAGASLPRSRSDRGDRAEPSTSNRIPPGTLILGTDNGSAFTARLDPARAQRARHHPPPRRLPRPRVAGLHRKLVSLPKGTLRLALRVRGDTRPGPGR